MNMLLSSFFLLLLFEVFPFQTNYCVSPLCWASPLLVAHMLWGQIHSTLYLITQYEFWSIYLVVRHLIYRTQTGKKLYTLQMSTGEMQGGIPESTPFQA